MDFDEMEIFLRAEGHPAIKQGDTLIVNYTQYSKTNSTKRENNNRRNCNENNYSLIINLWQQIVNKKNEIADFIDL